MKLSVMVIPAALSVAAVPLLAALPATAASPAASPAALPAAKAKMKSKNFDVARDLRKETVDGVTYTAAGSHAFKVKFKKDTKSSSGFAPRVSKVYGSALVVSASPAADSKLTLVSKQADDPKVTTGGTRKKPFVVVSTKFSGTARTQAGNLYYQEATMRTKVDAKGKASTSVTVAEPVRK